MTMSVGRQEYLEWFVSQEREEARRAGGHEPIGTHQLVEALGRSWNSGHARGKTDQELERALIAFETHASVMFGDAGGAVLTFALLARGGMDAPEWLVPLLEPHEEQLYELFDRSGKRDRDEDLLASDPYDYDGQDEAEGA